MMNSFDDTSIDPYVHAYKQRTKIVPSAIVLQSWYRMFERRVKYKLWKRRQTAFKHEEFRAWKIGFQARQMHKRQVMGKVFVKLKGFAQTSAATKQMSANLFERSMKDKKMSGLLEQTLAKDMGGDGGGVADKLHTDPERMRHIHYTMVHQHMYEAYRRRTLIKMWAGWRAFVHVVHQERQAAEQCLVRAWRAVKKDRPRWPLERVLTILQMWHRWAVFTKYKREGKPAPRFNETLGLWDNWLSSYYERRSRALASEERADPAKKRRYFMLLCRHHAHTIRKKHMKEVAETHFKSACTHRLLTAWNKYVRQKGKYNRLMRGVLDAWAGWAPRKASFRWRRQYIYRKRVVKFKIQIITQWLTVMRQRHMSEAYMKYQLFEVNDARRTILQKAIQGWLSEMTPQDTMAKAKYVYFSSWQRWRAWTHDIALWRKFRFVCLRALSMHLTKVVFANLRSAAAAQQVDAQEQYNATAEKLEEDLREFLQNAQKNGVNIEDAFKHFDKDSDGDITVAEFADGLLGLGFANANWKDVTKLVSKFDKDGDGTVSYGEFVRLISKGSKYVAKLEPPSRLAKFHNVTPNELLKIRHAADTARLKESTLQGNHGHQNRKHPTIHEFWVVGDAPTDQLQLDVPTKIASGWLAALRGRKSPFNRTDYAHMHQAFLQRNSNREITSAERKALKSGAHAHQAVSDRERSDSVDESELSRIGDTPLHTAADNGYIEEVRTLLLEGADTSATNLSGSTALHLAASHYEPKSFEIVVLLVEGGAPVHAKDSQGQTAFELACNPHVRTLLMQHTERLSSKKNFTQKERKLYMDMRLEEWGTALDLGQHTFLNRIVVQLFVQQRRGWSMPTTAEIELRATSPTNMTVVTKPRKMSLLEIYGEQLAVAKDTFINTDSMRRASLVLLMGEEEPDMRVVRSNFELGKGLPEEEWAKVPTMGPKEVADIMQQFLNPEYLIRSAAFCIGRGCEGKGVCGLDGPKFVALQLEQEAEMEKKVKFSIDRSRADELLMSNAVIRQSFSFFAQIKNAKLKPGEKKLDVYAALSELRKANDMYPRLASEQHITPFQISAVPTTVRSMVSSTINSWRRPRDDNQLLLLRLLIEVSCDEASKEFHDPSNTWAWREGQKDIQKRDQEAELARLEEEAKHEAVDKEMGLGRAAVAAMRLRTEIERGNTPSFGVDGEEQPNIDTITKDFTRWTRCDQQLSNSIKQLQEEESMLQQRLVGIGAELNEIATGIHELHSAIEKNKKMRRPFAHELDKVLGRGKKTKLVMDEIKNLASEAARLDTSGDNLNEKVVHLQKEITNLVDEHAKLMHNPEHLEEDAEDLQTRLHSRIHAKVKMEATRNFEHETAKRHRTEAAERTEQVKKDSFNQRELINYLMRTMGTLIDESKGHSARKVQKLEAGKLLDERANSFDEQQNAVKEEIVRQQAKLETVKQVTAKLRESLKNMGLLEAALKQVEEDSDVSLVGTLEKKKATKMKKVKTRKDVKKRALGGGPETESSDSDDSSSDSSDEEELLKASVIGKTGTQASTLASAEVKQEKDESQAFGARSGDTIGGMDLGAVLGVFTSDEFDPLKLEEQMNDEYHLSAEMFFEAERKEMFDEAAKEAEKKAAEEEAEESGDEEQDASNQFKAEQRLHARVRADWAAARAQAVEGRAADEKRAELTGLELWGAGTATDTELEMRRLAEMRRERHQKDAHLDAYDFSNFGQDVYERKPKRRPQLLLWLANLRDHVTAADALAYYKLFDAQNCAELDILEDLTEEQLVSKFGIPDGHAKVIRQGLVEREELFMEVGERTIELDSEEEEELEDMLKASEVGVERAVDDVQEATEKAKLAALHNEEHHTWRNPVKRKSMLRPKQWGGAKQKKMPSGTGTAEDVQALLALDAERLAERARKKEQAAAIGQMSNIERARLANVDDLWHGVGTSVSMKDDVLKEGVDWSVTEPFMLFLREQAEVQQWGNFSIQELEEGIKRSEKLRAQRDKELEEEWRSEQGLGAESEDEDYVEPAFVVVVEEAVAENRRRSAAAEELIERRASLSPTIDGGEKAGSEALVISRPTSPEVSVSILGSKSQPEAASRSRPDSADGGPRPESANLAADILYDDDWGSGAQQSLTPPAMGMTIAEQAMTEQVMAELKQAGVEINAEKGLVYEAARPVVGMWQPTLNPIEKSDPDQRSIMLQEKFAAGYLTSPTKFPMGVPSSVFGAEAGYKLPAELIGAQAEKQERKVLEDDVYGQGPAAGGDASVSSPDHCEADPFASADVAYTDFFSVEESVGGDQSAHAGWDDDAGDDEGTGAAAESGVGAAEDSMAAFDTMMKQMEVTEAQEAHALAKQEAASKDKLGIEGTKSSISFKPRRDLKVSLKGAGGGIKEAGSDVETQDEPKAINNDNEGGLGSMLGRMLGGIANVGVSAAEVEASIEEAKNAEAAAIAEYEAEEPGLSVEEMLAREAAPVHSHAQTMAPRQLAHYQRSDERPAPDRFTQTAAGRLQLQSSSGQIHKFVVETVQCNQFHNGIKWSHSGPLRADPLAVFQPDEQDLVLTGSAPVLHARPLTAAEMMADDQSYATTSDDELEDDMFAVDSSGAADRAAAPGAYFPPGPTEARVGAQKKVGNDKHRHTFSVVTEKSLRAFHQKYCPERVGQENDILKEFPPQTLAQECEKVFGARPEMTVIDPKKRAMLKMKAMQKMVMGIHGLDEDGGNAGPGVTKISMTQTPRSVSEVYTSGTAEEVPTTPTREGAVATTYAAAVDDTGEEEMPASQLDFLKEDPTRRSPPPVLFTTNSSVDETRTTQLVLEPSTHTMSPDEPERPMPSLSCSSTIFLSPRELARQATERLEKGESLSESQLLQQQQILGQMLELSESLKSIRTHPGFPNPSSSLFSGGLAADAASLIPKIGVSKMEPIPRPASSRVPGLKAAMREAALKTERGKTAAGLRSPSTALRRQSKAKLLSPHLNKTGPTTYAELKTVLQAMNIAPADDQLHELQRAFRETMPLVKFSPAADGVNDINSAGGTIGSEQWQERAERASTASADSRRQYLNAQPGSPGTYGAERLGRILSQEGVSELAPPGGHLGSSAKYSQRGIIRSKLQMPGGWEHGRTSLRTSAATPVPVRAHTANTLRGFDVQRFDVPLPTRAASGEISSVPEQQLLGTMGLSFDCTAEYITSNFSFLPTANELNFWQAVDAFLMMVKQLLVAQQRRVAVNSHAYTVCWTRASDIYDTFIDYNGDMALGNGCISRGVALELRSNLKRANNLKTSRPARSSHIPLAGPPPLTLFDEARKGTMVCMLTRLMEMGRTSPGAGFELGSASDGSACQEKGVFDDADVTNVDAGGAFDAFTEFAIEESGGGDQSAAPPQTAEDIANMKKLEQMGLELKAAQEAMEPKKRADVADMGVVLGFAGKMRTRADNHIIEGMEERAAYDAKITGTDMICYYMGGSIDERGDVVDVPMPGVVREIMRTASSPMELQKMLLRREGGAGDLAKAQSDAAQKRIADKKDADAKVKKKRAEAKAKEVADAQAKAEAEEQAKRDAEQQAMREAKEKEDAEAKEKMNAKDAAKRAKKEAKAAKKAAKKAAEKEKMAKRKATKAAAKAKASGGGGEEESHTGYTSSEDETSTVAGSGSDDSGSDEYSNSCGSDTSSGTTLNSPDATKKKRRKKRAKKKAAAKKKEKKKGGRTRQASTSSAASVATDMTLSSDDDSSSSSASSDASSVASKDSKKKKKKKKKGTTSLLKTATKNTAAGNLDFFSAFAAPVVKKNRRAQPWDSFSKKSDTVTVDDLERMRTALVSKNAEVQEGPASYVGIARDEEIVGDGFIKRRRMHGNRRIQKFDDPGVNRLDHLCESQKGYRDEVVEERRAKGKEVVFDPTALMNGN
jgi:Ca2+-binding EF-hand superfamily protein